MPKKADEDKYARMTLEEKKQLNVKAITDEIVELSKEDVGNIDVMLEHLERVEEGRKNQTLNPKNELRWMQVLMSKSKGLQR